MRVGCYRLGMTRHDVLRYDRIFERYRPDAHQQRDELRLRGNRRRYDSEYDHVLAGCGELRRYGSGGDLRLLTRIVRSVPELQTRNYRNRSHVSHRSDRSHLSVRIGMSDRGDRSDRSRMKHCRSTDLRSANGRRQRRSCRKFRGYYRRLHVR
jgi:hypothetical protein